MSSVAFTGFRPELIDFLAELRENNNREWFQAHRLFAAVEQPLPAATFSDQLPGLCFEHYQRVAPQQQWLVDLLGD